MVVMPARILNTIRDRDKPFWVCEVQRFSLSPFCWGQLLRPTKWKGKKISLLSLLSLLLLLEASWGQQNSGLGGDLTKVILIFPLKNFCKWWNVGVKSKMQVHYLWVYSPLGLYSRTAFTCRSHLKVSFKWLLKWLPHVTHLQKPFIEFKLWWTCHLGLHSQATTFLTHHLCWHRSSSDSLAFF